METMPNNGYKTWGICLKFAKNSQNIYNFRRIFSEHKNKEGFRGFSVNYSTFSSFYPIL